MSGGVRISQLYGLTGIDPALRRTIEDVIRPLQNLKLSKDQIDIAGLALALAQYYKSNEGILVRWLLGGLVDMDLFGVSSTDRNPYWFRTLRVEPEVDQGEPHVYVNGQTTSGNGAALITNTENGPVLRLSYPLVSGASAVLTIQNSNSTNFIFCESAGAFCDGTDWFPPSGAAMKEDHQALDDQNILDRIGRLPITNYRYRSQRARNTRRVGPTVEDFYREFHLGDHDSQGISPMVMASVATSGVKALKQRVEDLERENRSLEQRIQVLEAQSGPQPPGGN